MAVAERLLGFLEYPGDAPVEVKVGVIYWCSLHHVDAILARGDIHPGSDEERNHYLNRAGANVRAIYRDYRETKTYYEDTMYRAVLRTANDYVNEIKPRFDNLVGEVRKILSG